MGLDTLPLRAEIVIQNEWEGVHGSHRQIGTLRFGRTSARAFLWRVILSISIFPLIWSN